MRQVLSVRRLVSIPATLALVALAGCSDPSDEGYESVEAEMAETVTRASADMAAESETAGAGSEALPQLGELAVSLPKMAYVFDYGFSLPADDIADLQQQHADLCEAQGPYTCQILNMSHSGETGEYARGELQLAVVADKARAFGTQIANSAQVAGGEQVTSTLSGDDLSKAIVDTEARVRARTVLRDRLLETLRTRRGTVSELVEAERGVAAVNEEIDQARSWVAEMKGRVAFSRMNIVYESDSPAAGAFLSPISSAAGSIGGILGMIFAALIVIGAIAIPIGLVVFGLSRLRRWFGRKDAAQIEGAAA